MKGGQIAFAFQNITLCYTLQWRHNGRDSVSNHQPHDCSLNRLFRRRSKKTSKLRLTDLCTGNSPGTGEFPAQKGSYAENVSIWWRHHDILTLIISPETIWLLSYAFALRLHILVVTNHHQMILAAGDIDQLLLHMYLIHLWVSIKGLCVILWKCSILYDQGRLNTHLKGILLTHSFFPFHPADFIFSCGCPETRLP